MTAFPHGRRRRIASSAAPGAAGWARRCPTEPFQPPPYPYDRLGKAKALAEDFPGGMVDLSIGTPGDPPPGVVLDALRAATGGVAGYPASAGSAQLREAAARWMQRRFRLDYRPEVAACVGTKELVAGLPGWLRLAHPDRDVVLYPAVSYPSYEMGALLARCRPVPVPRLADGRTDLAAIDPEDARSALVLWVNSPSNPTGSLDDLAAAVEWAREHSVLVASDECYADFTWDGEPRSILEHGPRGVLAVHSLSKRSNMAGLRAGFYAGDPDMVQYLSEIRKHAGLMVPGPVQAAAAAALGDEEHVALQRSRYHERIQMLSEALEALGFEAPLPQGAFYIWARWPAGQLPGLHAAPAQGSPAQRLSGWQLAEWLAQSAGVLVGPGELYGDDEGHVRIAVVHPSEVIAEVVQRLKAI